MTRTLAAIAFAALAALIASPSEATSKKEKAPAKRPAPFVPKGYATQTEVKAFIDELVAGDAFDRAALLRIFSDAHYQAKIVEAMQRPFLEPPKWYEYAPRFISPVRIDGGVAYWNAHAAELAKAEETYGVPAEVVVAILGVETVYGRHTGGHRAIDALTTLAFDYPRRASFFRGELKQYLLLTRDLHVSPLTPKGSYAGALGMPQFMPSSYRNFAVDFDGNGRVDLWASHADIVGSVANYLARHDWQRGQPVLLPATIAPEARDKALAKLDGGLSERRALELWTGDGVIPDAIPENLRPDPVGLLLLEQGPSAADASYWIACHNFYVLTRYNRSRLYATAVWELAQAIKAARFPGAR